MIICLLHIGTFLGRSAAESEADCEACYPGSYCPLWAQTSVYLLCPPGWFCPPGSASGHQQGTVHIIKGQLRLNHSSLCTFFFFNTMSDQSTVLTLISVEGNADASSASHMNDIAHFQLKGMEKY